MSRRRRAAAASAMPIDSSETRRDRGRGGGSGSDAHLSCPGQSPSRLLPPVSIEREEEREISSRFGLPRLLSPRGRSLIRAAPPTRSPAAGRRWHPRRISPRLASPQLRMQPTLSAGVGRCSRLSHPAAAALVLTWGAGAGAGVGWVNTSGTAVTRSLPPF